jgi:hypothetical protein
METNKSPMKAVIVRRTISVSANVAWDVVRTGRDLERWVPVVTSCRLEGKGPGAKRFCTINGHDIVESIATVDDAARVMQYRIERQSLMPIRDALGTVYLSAAGSTETDVLWIMNFVIDDEQAWPAVKEGMEQIYSSAIDGLGAFARTGASLPR